MKKIFVLLLLLTACSENKSEDTSPKEPIVVNEGYLNKNISKVSGVFHTKNYTIGPKKYVPSVEANLTNLSYVAYLTATDDQTLTCNIESTIPLNKFLDLKTALDRIQVCRQINPNTCLFLTSAEGYELHSKNGIELSLSWFGGCSSEPFPCDSNVVSDLTKIFDDLVTTDLAGCN